MATLWYFALNGEQKGPVSSEALRALVVSRQLAPDDLVWKKGLTEWVKVAQVRELAIAPPDSREAKPVQVEPSRPSSEPEELRLVEPDEPQNQASRSQPVPQPASEHPLEQTSQAPLPPTDSRTPPQPAAWYLTRDGRRSGPFTAQMLKEKAVSGELLPTDYLWKHGLEDWVRAKSLPGLKFPAPKSPQAPVSVAQPIPLATDEPFAEIGTTSPDANSIFDVMNDQGFVSAPQTPNAALMATTFETGSRSRGRIEFESPPTEWAFLLAAFLVPIPLAFLFAYGYGVLRYYVPFYIVWYVSIFLIGSILSVSTCSLFEKAKFENMIVAVGYLLVLGGIVLYVAWATTITWAINSLPDEFERVYLADILVNPKAVFQIAVEISVHTESTSRRHGTTSSVVYFLLEAVFITVAPVYMTYKRYNESG